ncbi:histone-lysine N-methyltransferase SETMAR [Trichonephila clavipes]|nr:histone-lysine N-methyltransferase SETMAR [Trichonephila clavipes]
MDITELNKLFKPSKLKFLKNTKDHGSNASVACKNLCAVFGKDIVNVRICQRWFSKFRSGDLSLQERDRSGRPSKIDNDVLRSMLENNPHLTSQEIAEEFGNPDTTVGDHIKSLGFVLKRSVWVLHELTEKNLSDHVRMSSSHLIRHNVEPYLDKLITGDESGFFTRILREKILLQTRNIISNSSKTKYPSTKSTALFVVGQERSSVLRVAETGENHQRRSVLQSTG